MSEQVDVKVAAWMARLAEAINQIGGCDSGYGEFYISLATVAFDGDDTGYSIGPNEFGGYSLRFDPTPDE